MPTNHADQPRQVRQIRPTRRNVSGVYAFRGETAVPFESTLERDFLVRTEFSSLVLTVIPQPVRLEWRAATGRIYPYTPDFLVCYRDAICDGIGRLAPKLVEVKPREVLRERWHALKPKFRAAVRYAREQGWEFRVMDESRIRDQVFQNIVFLRRYRRMQFDPAETRWILDTLDRLGSAPFEHLHGRLFRGVTDRSVGIAHLWHLVAVGRIECDMRYRLDRNTELWVRSHE